MNFTFPYQELIPEITKVYKTYEALWKVDVTMYEIGNSRLVFPVLKENFLNDLCRGVKEILEKEPSLLKLNDDCVILGDLHGHILDLFRVLKKFGPPSRTNYVILGDLVDRGEFSLETATLVFVLKALFPNKMHIVRGNHEFPAMFQYNGFSEQIEGVYGSHIVTYAFANAFAYLPFAALVSGKVLCVHGGIGPGFTSILQIEAVRRPMVNYDDDPVISCVWSDPKEDVEEGFQESTRGIGYFFGKKALDNFLSTQGLTMLVRGHEPCENGVKKMFDGKLITVFGASNYCNYSKNKSGVLYVSKNGNIAKPTIFNPITYVRRASAAFTSPATTATTTSTTNLPRTFSSTHSCIKSTRTLPHLAKESKPVRQRSPGRTRNPATTHGVISLSNAKQLSRSSPDMFGPVVQKKTTLPKEIIGPNHLITHPTRKRI